MSNLPSRSCFHGRPGKFFLFASYVVTAGQSYLVWVQGLSFYLSLFSFFFLFLFFSTVIRLLE